MKNVLTPIAKIVLIPLGLMAATSATDAAIQKKKKKNVCIWDDCTDNLERRNRW